MHYKNTDRKLGLTGLMRVKNEAQTLAQSIDSCVKALDELIITYNDSTDGSVQIIENKKLQYPDKIIVVPYPYHVFIGTCSTYEEFEYAKSLPVGHPQHFATYCNNALQYVNYKYVLIVDADEIYFPQTLESLRNSIVKGVNQNKLERFCGKVVNSIFCQRRDNRRIWSKYHPLHWLQYIIVPLLRKQYMDFAIAELLKGDGYLSLSGVNVLRYHNQWYTPPIGCKWDNGMWWPYMGNGDHLVFEANEQTEYLPWDFTNGSGKKVLIERFDYPKGKMIFLLGFYWFHLKPMKKPLYDQCLSYFNDYPNLMLPVNQLRKVSFNRLLRHLDKNNDNLYLFRRNYFNFVHNLDKKAIRAENLDLSIGRNKAE
jgi:glycosyltransferase involved in cell wall biosynthesis